MIGKREVLRQFQKQRWSWGDVEQQTVPEAAFSHRKRKINLSNLLFCIGREQTERSKGCFSNKNGK